MKFKDKKSQAAMEFLMTYGWAILVVLAAIAALAYFGVLSPTKFIPEKCVLDPGMACLDFSVSTNQVELVISNSMGKDIDINSITVGGCSETFNQSFANGDQSNFVITGCSNGNSGDTFKEDISIDYTTSAFGLSKKTSGAISGKVQ